MKSSSFLAALKINTPNGLAFAFVTTTTLEEWLKVAALLTSIVCTILATRHQMKKGTDR